MAEPAKLDRWRYAVAIAKFVNHMLSTGMPSSLAVLVPELVFQLDLDYATVGFLLPMQIGVIYLVSPISNYVSTRLGHRRVAMISGILAGISLMGSFFSRGTLSLGFSFFLAGIFTSPLNQSATVMLLEHFGKMYGVASAFTFMGGQVGGIFLPYVTVLCLDKYGMRGALLCLSGILFFNVAAGATLRSPQRYNSSKDHRHEKPQRVDDEELVPMKSGTSQSGRDKSIGMDDGSIYENDKGSHSKTWKSSNDGPEHGPEVEIHQRQSKWSTIIQFMSSILSRSVLKNERIYIFLFIPCQTLVEVSMCIWLTFPVAYGVSVGIPPRKAAYLIIAGSVGGFTGRLALIAFLYKRPHLSPYTYPATSLIASVALCIHPISSSVIYLLACSFFAGFGFCAAISSFLAISALRVEKNNFPSATAVFFLTVGIIYLSSGTLAGLFYDLTGSFKVIFVTMGVFLAIHCAVFSSYLLINARLKQ